MMVKLLVLVENAEPVEFGQPLLELANTMIKKS